MIEFSDVEYFWLINALIVGGMMWVAGLKADKNTATDVVMFVGFFLVAAAIFYIIGKGWWALAVMAYG